MQHRTPILAVALLAALALGACGDDDPELAGGDGTGGAGGPAPATVTVDIGAFLFDPTPVRVSVGDSVVWHNAHDQAHTSTGNGDQSWNTTNIEPGSDSDPVRFDAEGTYTYVCGLHPFMEGTVEVSS